MTHPWFLAGPAPRVLAHRGLVTPEAADSGIVENSFAAVAAAHAAGARYVESDCHLTADGCVVLFHDDDLLRVTGDPRPVASVTERELERLMSERGGLLTLEQALSSFPDLRFNLDVKAAAAAVPTGQAVARFSERVLLTSFSDERRNAALAAARSHARGGSPATSAGRETLTAVIAALLLRRRAAARRRLDGIDALQIPERHGRMKILSRRLLDLAHDAGVEVHVWTVNDEADMRRLVDAGVDGIVTDRADRALAVL